jgi:hypothetical protein
VYSEELGTHVLHHPLVVQVPYLPQLNALCNQWLAGKTEATERAMLEGKFHHYVFLHERPYRLPAFMRVMDDDRMEDEDYWSLLRDVWVDTEFPSRNRTAWRKLFMSNRDRMRQSLMDAGEYHTWHNLPDRVRVYRGCDIEKETRQGISWTLDPTIALWFANRFGRSGQVISGEVGRDAIRAVFNGRGESEAVIVTDFDWEAAIDHD